MQAKQLTYVDFDDIEEFICKELGISVDQFRDYKLPRGRTEFDLWHLWCDFVIDDLSSDSYKTLWTDLLTANAEVVLRGKHKLREKLLPVIEKLATELQNIAQDDHIVVWYSW